MLWAISLLLFMIWFVGVLLGKGRFLHILILSSTSIAFILLVANHRARQG